jgi:hypothetical protein
MLARQWVALVWIAAALIGAIWGFADVRSAHHAPPIKSEQRTDATNQAGVERNSSETFWQRTTSDPVAFFTLWVALFTCALAVSTVGLWIVTYWSLDHARREFLTTHRPRLIVRQFEIDPIFENFFVKVYYSIVNVGNSDAILTSTTSQIILCLDEDESIGVDPVARPLGMMALPPGARIAGTAEWKKEITELQGEQIRNGVLTVCALGEITYMDGQGTVRRTRFRRTYKVFADKFVKSADEDQEYED